jgi:Uma2 family endonuclease
MREAAPMSLDEFLRWDDGTDTSWELIDGCPTAMAPPAQRTASWRCGSPPGSTRACRAGGPATPRSRPASYYVADIAVTCRPNEPGRRAILDPILLVEILSPGTERHDRRTKLPVYRQIDSVQEILLIDADAHYAEVRRRDGNRWLVELVRGPAATLSLASVELWLAMSELYEGIATASAASG